MSKELNIGLSVTNKAKMHMRTLFQRERIDDILKDEYYDFYLQNAGETYEYDTKVRLLLASDSKNECNINFIEEYKDKVICIEGFNSDSRHFCIISVSLISKYIAKNSNRSILKKIKFYEEENIKMSSFPEEILSKISEFPDIKDVRKNIDKRINDWEEYLKIIEVNAEKSELIIKYRGFKQSNNLSECTFMFNKFSNNDTEKLKNFRNERVTLVYKNNELESIDEDCDYLEGKVIGNIKGINYFDNSIDVELESESQELALEGNLNFNDKGFLKISKIGDLSQVHTLKRGLNNLKNGEAKNSNLDIFLFDAKSIGNYRDSISINNDELLFNKLNETQKNAVEGVLGAKDMFLIQGPPGTGKTTVIAEICYQNSIRGMKTLVASQSNLAVDNALGKLINNPKIRILRTGNLSSVEEDGEKYTEENIINTWLDNTLSICKEKVYKKEEEIEDIDNLKGQIDTIHSLIINKSQIDSDILDINNKLEIDLEEIKKFETSMEFAKNKNKELDNYNKKLNILNYRLMKVNKLLDKLKEEFSIIGLFLNDISSNFEINDKVISSFENKVKHIYFFKDKLNETSEGFIKAWKDSVIRNLILANGYIKYINDLLEKNKKEICLNNSNFYNFDDELISKVILQNREKIEKYTKERNRLLSLNKSIIKDIETFNNKLNNIFNENVVFEKFKSEGDFREFYLDKLINKKEELENYMKISKEWMEKICEKNYGNKESLKELYIDNANVIGTTCVQSGSRNFTENYPNFDVVIIDEVSKATPPELILPMLKAKKIVLVGDHKQLPPMIGENTLKELKDKLENEQSDNSKNDKIQLRVNNIKKSLFEELFLDADDKNKTMLDIQYRMHSSIMDTVNQFYINENSRGLKCGINDVNKTNHRITTTYLNSRNNILWVDIPLHRKYFENKDNTNSSYNETEIEVIKKILYDINESVKELSEKKEVAIITFYRAQEKLLKNIFTSIDQYRNLKIRVGTVDRFQGIEREIVIVSFVRNNNENDIGFAKDPERVNVALSRAKNLLIIVGCSKLFCEDNKDRKSKKIYNNVLKVVNENNGIRDVYKIFN